jgi:hypothetical protein
MPSQYALVGCRAIDARWSVQNVVSRHASLATDRRSQEDAMPVGHVCAQRCVLAKTAMQNLAKVALTFARVLPDE